VEWRGRQRLGMLEIGYFQVFKDDAKEEEEEEEDVKE